MDHRREEALVSEEVRFTAGDVIFREGDPALDVFLVLGGEVDITLRAEGRHGMAHVASLGAGEVFGEMSIVDRGPRSATAVAAGPTVCLRFPAERVLDLIRERPETTLEILRTLVTRLRAANRKLACLG
ncbi:MAG: Crp/Fnr family transcriptional regulator [Paracoccaceae bacterium]